MKAWDFLSRLISVSPTPLLILALSTLAAHAVAEVDYVRDIKPLLKAECVKCHGRSTQKAGLRLDTAAHALRGGERGPAVTPGHAETSLLLQAVKGTHAELPQMPYKRLPLDPAKVRLLEGWIESGADAPNHEQPSDDRHWAYIPPIRPQLPKTEPAAAHPIDAFVRVALSTAEL